MLPASNRLRKRRDFERVFSSKPNFSGPFFRFIAVKGQIPISRVGIVVSGKVSKKAVVRNKIRRRIYTLLKPYILGADKTNPLDIVIIALKGAGDLGIEETRFEIERAAAKIF